MKVLYHTKPKIKQVTEKKTSGQYGWDNGWVFSEELPKTKTRSKNNKPYGRAS